MPMYYLKNSMQEIHYIAQEGCNDLRFKPTGKLPEVLSLPHKSDSWSAVQLLRAGT